MQDPSIVTLEAALDQTWSLLKSPASVIELARIMDTKQVNGERQQQVAALAATYCATRMIIDQVKEQCPTTDPS